MQKASNILVDCFVLMFATVKMLLECYGILRAVVIKYSYDD